MAEWTGYPYWVEERNLDFRLLFWKWRFGNAILSKHPITETTVIDLPGFWALESLPVGKKRGVVCDIQVGGKLIRIAGVHLCHRSEPFRAKPADPLGAMAAESPHAFCFIGDLNSTAPKFRLPANVPQGVNAIRVLDACERLRRSPRSKPTVAQMTFHSSNPSAVIDWIMVPRDWEFRSHTVVPSNLSNHRRVTTDARSANGTVGSQADEDQRATTRAREAKGRPGPS